MNNMEFRMVVEEILKQYRDKKADTEFTAKLLRRSIREQMLNEILEEFKGGYYPIPVGGKQCTDCIIDFVEHIVRVGARS